MHNLAATLLIQRSDMDIRVVEQPFIQHVCSFLICASLVCVCVFARVVGNCDHERLAARCPPRTLRPSTSRRATSSSDTCCPSPPPVFSRQTKIPAERCKRLQNLSLQKKKINKKSTKRSPYNARKNPRSWAEHNRLRGWANFVRVNKTGLPRPAGERKTGQK